ncbi:MAG: TonB-dependent receptor plug domain-containing protein [Myxococcales bacterium]
MLLNTKALTTTLLSGLCVSAMAAAQESRPAGQTPPPAEMGVPTPAVGQPDTTGTPEATGTTGAQASGKRAAEETITVTGSRIRRKDLTTPAPVTVISREQVVASGKVSIGDFLQSLPEQGNAINTSVNNGGSGATRVSLRGLGANRTLVLLNGRRMVPGGTGADDSVDLNSIPTAAIERIEVLKDGASAVYGSDAIAGVVNIITRKNYRQTDIGAYTGITPHGDGTTYDFNVTTGTGGDRGNITFSAGYYNQQPVWAGARDFANIPRTFQAADPTDPTAFSGEFSGTASSTIPQGRFALPKSERTLPNGNSAYQTLINTYGSPSISSFIKCTGTEAAAPLGSNPKDPKNTCQSVGWRPFDASDMAPVGDLYNFQPENYLVTPQQRLTLYSAGDTRIGSFARGFFEAHFVNRQSDQKLAAEPLVIGPGGETVTVSATNAFNPFNRDFVQFRRRLLEFSNRTTNQDINTIRVVGGLDGTLSDDFGPLQGWFWEASVNYGRTQGDNVKTGNLYVPALAAAIGPSFRDTNGVLRCGTGASTVVEGCVPLNLFGGPGTITGDQIAGLTFTGTERGINQLVSVNLNTSGELIRLFGDRPLGLAAGYEFRTMKGTDIPDPITAAGLTTGNKATPTQGSYYVNEGYGELSVPLLSNMPGVQNLEATAAARVFRYSTFGSDWTYKFGGRYTPVRDVTVRGTYSTAFRAPSIADLFLGSQDNFANVTDPCAKNAPATCTGTAFNNGDPSTQLRSHVGGSPNLKPETAKTWTLGLVLEPTMIKNFTVTLDYYNITIDSPIVNVGSATILNSCYFGGVQRFCDLITRDPVSGQVSNIVDTTTNVGRDQTDGVDLAVRYAYPSEYGRFGFLFDGTWLHSFHRLLADQSEVSARGTFDLATTGGVFPAFKFNAGATWSLGGFGAGVNSKFIGSFHECADDTGFFGGGSICTSNGGTPQFQRLVPAYVTLDVYASYTLRSPAGRTTLAAGVNNVGDHKPAVIYNGFLAASDPTAYDFMGRFGYVRLTHTF